jgi:hypothetical protein
MSTTSKILGESEPEFSEQFKGVLTLMSDLWDLSDMWWDDEESTPTRDMMFMRSAAKLGHQHVKKYGRSPLTDKITKDHTMEFKWLNDDFWVELFGYMALAAIEAINSGQLQPYDELESILMGHSLGFSITSEKTPESLPVMTAIANAMDFEIGQLYNMVNEII